MTTQTKKEKDKEKEFKKRLTQMELLWPEARKTTRRNEHRARLGPMCKTLKLRKISNILKLAELAFQRVLNKYNYLD